MRIIHAGGFPADERRQNRAVIYSNLIVAFKVILDIMETEGIQFEREETKVCSRIRYIELEHAPIQFFLNISLLTDFVV